MQGVKQENVQQIFKGPELPSFQQAIFKIKNKGKYLKCVINSWILQIVQSFFWSGDVHHGKPSTDEEGSAPQTQQLYRLWNAV